MSEMRNILAEQRLEFISTEELAPADMFNPDSTVARQARIRHLMRMLDRERRACLTVEAFADQFRDWRTMQAATRLSNAEAQLRHAGGAVAFAWERYVALRPPDHEQGATRSNDTKTDKSDHGEG